MTKNEQGPPYHIPSCRPRYGMVLALTPYLTNTKNFELHPQAKNLAA